MNEFKMDILENPEIYQQNRVAAHSDHVCYRDWEEKAAAEGTLPDVLGKGSSFRFFLDGTFKFHYARNYEQTIAGFEREGLRLSCVGRYQGACAYPDGGVRCPTICQCAVPVGWQRGNLDRGDAEGI